MEEYKGKIALAYLLAFLFMGGIIVTSPQLTPEGSSALHEVSSVNGSPGIELERREYIPTSKIVLLNQSPSINSSSWTFDYMGAPEVEETPEGLRITMAAKSWSWKNTSFCCSTMVSPSVQYFNSLIYSSCFSVHSGMVKAKLEVRTSSPYDEIDFSKEKILKAGEKTELALNDTLANLKKIGYQERFRPSDNSTTLVLQTWFSLRITPITNAEINLHYMAVDAFSTENLATLLLDPQSPDGTSLSESAYLPWLANSPSLNITCLEDNRSALLYFPRGREQLFLPPGNYTGYAGWERTMRYAGGSAIETLVPVAINLGEAENVSCEMRLPCCKMQVRITPAIPHATLRIQVHNQEIYNIGMHGKQNDVLLFVPMESEESQIYISSRIEQFPSYRRYPRIPSISGTVNLDSVWRVTITVSDGVLLGVLLTPLEIYALITVIIIAVLALPRILKFIQHVGITNLLSRPITIPFLFLTASMMFPWLIYENEASLFMGPELVVFYVFNVPFSTHIFTSESSIGFMMPEVCMLHYPIWWTEWSYAVRDILISLVLFWIPWIYFANKIRTKSPTEPNARNLLFLFMPAITIPLLVIFNVHLHFSKLSVGAFLALTAPVAYLLIIVIQHFRSEQVPLA